MDFSAQTSHKQEPLLAVTSPVEESKLGLPPAILAGLACVVPLLGAALGLVEREQPFVKHYGVQSLIFWVVALVAGWLSRILLGGEGVFSLFMNLVFSIPMLIIFLVLCGLLAMLVYHAFNGLVWYLPYTRKFLVGPLDPMKQAAAAANNVAQRRG